MPPKRVILAIVIIAIVLLIWSGTGTRVSSADAVADKVFIDQIPENPRAMMSLMYFHDGAGFIGKMSTYRTGLDQITWTSEGDTLSMHALQEDRKTKHRVRVWSCAEGEAPDPELEFCMDFDGKKYFGLEVRPDSADEIMRTGRLPL